MAYKYTSILALFIYIENYNYDNHVDVVYAVKWTNEWMNELVDGPGKVFVVIFIFFFIVSTQLAVHSFD